MNNLSLIRLTTLQSLHIYFMSYRFPYLASRYHQVCLFPSQCENPNVILRHDVLQPVDYVYNLSVSLLG